MLRTFRRSLSGVGVQLNFRNHAEAYKHRTLWELTRALLVLKACSYDAFVDNSQWLLSTGQRMLGRRLFTALVGPTFYRQFVGGSSLHEMQACVGQLRCAQVRPMVACPLEEEGDATDVEPSDSATGLYERNGEAILRCLNMTAQLGPGIPLMQLKMSGLLPASVLVKHLPIAVVST
ncbi:hypothetical protein HPB47_028139 [Ixodes persulcatus]|uniref:Uncharacterized protein n=1 Tax=Ixodes persulcatus TaxID=34615 RepID=A0AC60PUA0_IXOPE|nr:hypothetical protein HPB47_028139 [Ixodes persulcatus]